MKISLLLSLGILLGTASAILNPSTHRLQQLEWLEAPRELGNFTLVSSHGPITQDSFKGHWTVLTAGFLSCPTVCPTSLRNMAELAEQWPSSPARPPPQFVFISVDTNRDRPSKVEEYARNYHNSFLGVVGTEAALQQLSRTLGLRSSSDRSSKGIALSHSSGFFLLDPLGQLRGRFPASFSPYRLAQELSVRLQSTPPTGRNSPKHL